MPLQASGTVQRLGGLAAGVAYEGGGGSQGSGAFPDQLVMTTGPLTPHLGAGPTSLQAAYTGNGTVADLNGFMVQPEFESLVLGNGQGFRALLRSFATSPTTTVLGLSGYARSTISVYDGEARLVATGQASGKTALVQIEPGGFSVVTGQFTTASA
jgi:hypothetical protein